MKTPVVFEPYGPMILLTEEQHTQKSEGGIILTDTSNDPHRVGEGRVLAVGPAVENYKAGDLLMFSGKMENARHWIKGKQYLLVNEASVLGKVVEDEVE